MKSYLLLAVQSKSWGSLLAFAASKGNSKPRKEKKILVTLESFLSDLDKTYQTLIKYSEEDRKDSRLTLEVKVSLTSCCAWAELIEQKKIPPNLVETIEQRAKSLNFVISQEVLEQTIRINQKAKILVAISKLDKKKPWEYYEDGKYLISQKKWLDAKTNFLAYRHYVEAKTPIMTDKDDNGIKPPSVDSHLKYLSYVQDQLSEQGTQEEPNPILSVAPAGKNNQYKADWAKWEALYMKK